MPEINLLTLVLIISFFIYGSRCLFAKAMISEFQRWRVPHLRHITGLLEVLGALGLVLGHWLPLLGMLAAAGLSLLMVCGIWVRISIKDTFLQTLPAVIFLIVSLLVAWRFASSMCLSCHS